jgi:hypothetical protein
VNSNKLILALAFLVCGSMLLTLLPTSALADSEPSYVFFTENVEEPTFEEWHVRWHKSDQNPDSSLDAWCRQMHRAYTGTHAAWCARQGYNSHYINSTGLQPMNVNITTMQPPLDYPNMVLRYDTNMDSVMRKEVVGARYYNNVTLTFWFYSDAGASDARQPGSNEYVGYDFLNVVYYTGTTSSMTKHVLWTDSEAQATAKTWTDVSVSIPNTATWVGFEFVSGTVPPEGGDLANALTAYGVRTNPAGSTGMREGAFIDDVTLVGTDPVGDVPLITHADPLATYQTNSTFPIAYSDNDPPYTSVQWIYLYYRPSGTGDWTKYTNDVKPSGAFVSSPISFTVTQDGIYEFFTQGFDTNGTLEDWRGVADAYTTIDSAAPATMINITGDNQNGAYSGPVMFTLNATDATSGVDHIAYRLDGADWSNYTDVVGLSTTGAHLVEYFAVDKAGNVEATRSVNLTIGNGVAGVTFQQKNQSFPDGNVTIHFNVAASSSITKLEYSLDGSSYVALEPNATSVSLTGLTEGKHTLTVKAEDSSNNVMVGQTEFTVGKSSTTGSADSAWSDPLVLALVGIVAVAAIGGGVFIVRRKKK